MNVLTVRYGLIWIALATGCFAGDSKARPNFRAEANVVLINATVLDGNNRPVRGLARDSFRLLDERAEQRIVYFGEEETPLSLVVVFDTSGSMVDRIAGSRQALSAVLGTSNQEDEFSLITFSERPEVTIAWTSDTVEIQNGALLRQPRGRTPLLDAVQLAFKQVNQSRNPRRAIVIFSDGGDNHSQNTERQVSRLLEEADVQIYAVEMAEPEVLRERSPEEMAGPGLLARLCDRAGGRYFEAVDRRELKAVADQIGRELRSQYVLGYVPSQGARDGRFHHVQVKLLRPAGAPRVSIFWRRGYRRHAE